jgi:stage II sporulation protein D
MGSNLPRPGASGNSGFLFFRPSNLRRRAIVVLVALQPDCDRMPSAMTTCDLARWTPEAGVEPRLRVGVVLPSDQMRSIRLTIPDVPYRLMLDGRASQTPPAGAAEVVCEGQRVRFRTDGEVSEPAHVVGLVPAHDPPLERGAGVEVRGVLTGRGFHWQKRTHFRIPGAIEFRVADEHLLVVNELPLEQYLACVVTSEMSGACPLEFLRSQVLVARAWVLVHTEDKHPGLPIDRCNDDCCQRYQGTTFLTPSALEAVRSTRGQAIFHAGGGIIDANYSKSCGGIIEAPELVWGVHKPGQRSAVDAPKGSAMGRFLPVTQEKLSEYLDGPWLARTDCFCSPNIVPEGELPRYLGGVDVGGRYFRWTLRYNREDLEQVLLDKVFCRQDPSAPEALGTLTDLRPIRRGNSGRVIEMAVHYLDPMGNPQVHTITDQYRIRDSLHEKFLYSSAFDVRIERDGEGIPARIALNGAGWGHGAGLCQIGALGMALQGYDAAGIVSHYFADVSIRTCY